MKGGGTVSELEKLYTVDEIAGMTSLTTRTIRNYLRSGVLKGRKIGGQWRFTTKDIERFMNEGEVCTEMEKEQKQMVMDFVDGVYTDAEGGIQACTIVDIYTGQSEAKKKNDAICGRINQMKDDAFLRYKYDYIQAEGKARYILFASPDFIKDVMEILK